MLVYHYSKSSFPRLETLEYRGTKSDSKPQEGVYKLLGNYNQHVSFFLDPIPFQVMGKIYGKDHHTWYSGNELYQYIVDTDKIGNFNYHIVETPEKLKLFYDDNLSDNDYEREIELLVTKNKIIGNQNELNKAARPYVGTLRDNINKVHRLPNWDSIKNKYAAGVTHLMIYPETGFIDYEERSKIKIR